MRFLTQHPTLVFVSFFASLGLFYLTGLAAKRLESASFSPSAIRFLRIFSFVLMASFLIGAYLSKPVYYFPNNIGTLGDNYCHMIAATQAAEGTFAHHIYCHMTGHSIGKHYIMPQHPLYPCLPENLLFVLQKMGFLSKEDPFYFEKAFTLGSLYSRLGLSLALLAVFWMFRRYTGSFLNGLLAFFTLGVSYGCWIWALQSNALGIAMAVQLLVFVAMFRFRETRHPFLPVLIACLICCLIYLHMATLYFCLAAYLTMILFLFQTRAANPQRVWQEARAFHLALTLWIITYYALQTQLYHTWDYKAIFVLLTQPDYFEPFGASFQSFSRISKTVADNLSTGLLNYANIWSPASSWETAVIAVELTTLFSLALSLFTFAWKRFLRQDRFALCLFGLTSLLGFMGFFFRNAGTHYYVVAAVPNICLMLWVFLSPTHSAAVATRSRILLLVLVLATFTFNGFSSQSVMRGRDPMEHSFYRESTWIRNDLPPQSNQEAYYYRPYEFAYEIDAMRSYYKTTFKAVHWVPQSFPVSNPKALKREIAQRLASGRRVYVNAQIADALNLRQSYSLTPIQESLFRLDPQ